MESKLATYNVTAEIKNIFGVLDISSWFEGIGIPYTLPVQAGVWFLVSFFIGFIGKKFFKVLFVSALLAGTVLFLMDYGNLIAIDWPALQATFGIPVDADATTMVTSFFTWIKDNAALSAACLFGLLLGCKVG